ncbi:MAG TPA: hypothetical protein ENN99_06035 [Chloroflexi bacterium]|nr:hypothetical protein [Chloroflexota bacterium]
MSLYEYVGNPHVHTSYSDGTAIHTEIAQAAAKAKLDYVIVTDHNVWVDGCERHYGQLLLLVGEEIHDVRRRPQANHLLVYQAEAELARQASDPQTLINAVNEQGGFCCLAHPFEYGSSFSPDLMPIPWVDWDVNGYAGFEIWNYMSEFKALVRNRLAALFYAYFPATGITGPFRATLYQWDRLLTQGKRIAAIGGADAHGNSYTLGPLKRTVFPYAYLFRCVNTHIITERPFNGELAHDKELVYDALRAGHTWVGYDLLAPTAGFRFHARSITNEAILGDELVRTGATKFFVQTPHAGNIHLVHNGRVVARARGQQLQYTSAEPGPYRVEVYRTYRMGRRGWIFSSPIYVT